MMHIVWGRDADTAHFHANVAEARECERHEWVLDAEARAEIEAEMGWVRAAESGSYAGSYEDARDRFFDSLAGR